jgi:NADH-quinone oxidoreductase subunit L
VVGESTLRVTGGTPFEMSHGMEYGLVAVAVLIAIAGIATAWTRLDPAKLVPKREAKAEEGFQRVLEEKYYVDEIYDRTIVKPTVGISRALLWRGVDQGLIDGAGVNGSAWLARIAGSIGSSIQSGQLGTYAWVLVLGVILVVGAFTWR